MAESIRDMNRRTLASLISIDDLIADEMNPHREAALMAIVKHWNFCQDSKLLSNMTIDSLCQNLQSLVAVQKYIDSFDDTTSVTRYLRVNAVRNCIRGLLKNYIDDKLPPQQAGE